MKYSSLQKQELVKGLGVMLGEALFGLNGPYLFVRFGLNIPLAALAGSLVGAGVGYATADALLRVRNRRHPVSTVPDITEPEVEAGLDDLCTRGAGGTVDAGATQERIEEALSRLAEQQDEIRVEVRNTKVVLKGTVHSWEDEAEAERIAFDTPGIEEVENRLEVVR